MNQDTINGWLNRHTDGLPNKQCNVRIWLIKPYLEKTQIEGIWKPRENMVECEIHSRKGFNQSIKTSYYFANPEADDDFVYYQIIDKT